MVERHLHHGESDAYPLRPGGDRRTEDQRVGIGHRAVEVVLGEPHGIHADLFRQLYLAQRAVDDPMVILPVIAYGENEAAEAHCVVLIDPLNYWLLNK